MPSSAILAMQYMPTEQALYLVFHSRVVYRYSEVPIEEWREFLAADSKGTYLNQVFKLREHPYDAVAEPLPSPQEGTNERLEWGETGVLRKKGARSVQLEPATGKITA